MVTWWLRGRQGARKQDRMLPGSRLRVARLGELEEKSIYILQCYGSRQTISSIGGGMYASYTGYDIQYMCGSSRLASRSTTYSSALCLLWVRDGGGISIDIGHRYREVLSVARRSDRIFAISHVVHIVIFRVYAVKPALAPTLDRTCTAHILLLPPSVPIDHRTSTLARGSRTPIDPAWYC